MENNTHGANTSFLKSGNMVLYTEKYTVGERMMFLLVGTFALMINIPAVVVLRKTKKVPYAGKFLSSNLLMFDALFIFLSTLRKFISYPMVNVTLQLLGTSAHGLSVISIAMMAAERYALFFYPMEYLRRVTDRVIRVTSCCIWAGYVFGHWMLRYGVCYARLRTDLVFMQAGICNNFVLMYMLTCVTITTIVCVFSYVNIIVFVRKKAKATAPSQEHTVMRRAVMQEYKSTMFVFMCTGVMCLSFVAYGIILVLNVLGKITIDQNRNAFESVSLMNCIMDPLWYVLWFKECRLEGLKIMAHFNHKLLPKAEQMRIEVFNIVTTTVRHETNKFNGKSKMIVERHKEVTKTTTTIMEHPSDQMENNSGFKTKHNMLSTIHYSYSSKTLNEDLELESLDGVSFSSDASFK